MIIERKSRRHTLSTRSVFRYFEDDLMAVVLYTFVKILKQNVIIILA